MLLLGYIGYDDDKNLVNMVRKKPSCVVLFDEIEKAHVDVLNILLQILEDGKLTNSNGAVASFQETFIILTSNLGAEIMNKKGGIGFRSNEESFNKNDVIAEVKKSFRPELINRLDEIVIFNHLDKKDIYKILENQISQLKEVMKRKNIVFDVSDDVKKNIVEKSDYFQYGARTVRREIENQIEDVIVDKIINKELKEGEKIVV